MIPLAAFDILPHYGRRALLAARDSLAMRTRTRTRGPQTREGASRSMPRLSLASPCELSQAYNPRSFISRANLRAIASVAGQSRPATLYAADERGLFDSVSWVSPAPSTSSSSPRGRRDGRCR